MSVLVTGATSGLGRATSGELAAAGWHVILGCRDPQRGAAVAREIRATTGNTGVEVQNIDLASLASVRAAAAALGTAASRPPLHALVCNAGIQVVDGLRRSADGYELTFATNHLGHYLLITSLLDRIAEPGRIVLVSSGTHYGGFRSLGFPAPRWADPRTLAEPPSTTDTSARGGRVRYATSKLANIYTAYELARRAADRKLVVSAFDPGLMPQTGLDRDYPERTRRLYDRLTPLLVRVVPGARTVADSAGDLAWLVTNSEAAELTGAYVVRRTARRSSRESYDLDRAGQLWAASAELTALER
jgi:protochlorophyllide reductase